ncbi:MAG TPA: GntR family transcriptional regulator [Gemmatimonadota bacterium]|nr:GntR family transcriptional regulator [Gemmatimonadota bacterium]
MQHRKADVPKYEQVRRAVEADITSGRWGPGDRLPSEAELVERFGVSRITVGRAMRDLQRAGLVERRPGSGTYVASPMLESGLSFGLLIPDLGETEIFEPMCQGMMASPLARRHALVWGSPNGGSGGREARAWHLCRQYVERGVSGVFFAPLEFVPAKDEINQRISRELEAAGIPVVLLDRTVTPYPERGPHDLVGIDNRRAGYVMTEHLIHAGARRIAFVGVPDAAATVDAREAGYREALHRAGLSGESASAWRLDPAAGPEVERRMRACAPDGIVCANDRTAARLMHTLLELGHDVPGAVRLVGIDDLEYAELLPVPLTTYRQPTPQIGAEALAVMLERLERPDLPIRDVLLHGELVVRRSSGVTGAVHLGGR